MSSENTLVKNTKGEVVDPYDFSSIDSENLVILVDSSSSMSWEMSGSSITRCIAADRALSKLREISDYTTWHATKLFFFQTMTTSAGTFENEPPKIRPAGGTNYLDALQEGRGADRIILISDGEPNGDVNEIYFFIDENLPGIPIDTVFIGPDDPSLDAYQILREISDRTGGIFSTADNPELLAERVMQLEASNRLLLTHEAGGDSVIKL